MNINCKKKTAIIELYNKGVTMETLQLATGLSETTIQGIINSSMPKTKYQKTYERLLKEWDAAFH